jgi:HlyD family secretion protein
MKRPGLLVALVSVVVFVVWWLLQQARGPVFDGYQVASRPLVQTVVATGRVVAVSRTQVGSPVTGVVLERRVREGDVVQPGDILAVLRADDLEAALQEAQAALSQLQQSARPQAQAALREAEARLAQASRETARRRDLFERRLIAREVMEQAVQAEIMIRSATEQARLAASALSPGQSAEQAAQARVASALAQLAKTTLRAEMAGTVLSRNVEPGDLVQPGRILFEIASAGATEVLVPLDEKNLEVLALGQTAICIADAYPTRPFDAELSFIAPSIDPQRGSVDVRLTVSPVPDFLRQDMTVSVNIQTGRRDVALVVPNDALSAVEGDRAQLWVVVEGRAVRRSVQLGLRGIAMSEITQGLQAGDWVLADGSLMIEAGSRARVKASAAPTDASDPATRKELPARFD